MRARRGNVALTFVFSLIPILALVGAAVDYTSANSVRTSLQLAVDSTALMLSKNASSASPAMKCRASAETYFAALFKRPDATNTKITASYSTTAGSQIVISASADMDNEFMGILGLKDDKSHGDIDREMGGVAVARGAGA